MKKNTNNNLDSQIINEDWNIVWENASKVYPNGTKGLTDVNLSINQGEFVAVIGLSGAGKTTLIKTVNKISGITSGTLKVGPYVVNDLKGKKLRKFRTKIGIIFQNYNLVENISVLQNVLSARLPQMNKLRAFFGFYSKKDIELAYQCLAKVNILENAYDMAKDLSGGQMQRVALARTLAQKPKIILADEPVGALDPIMAKSVMDGFLIANKSERITIVANLHHVDLALQYADRIVGVKKGKIIFNDSWEKVNLEQLKEIYGEKLEQFDEEQFIENRRKRQIIQNEVLEKIKLLEKNNE
ncbi:phosphonate ABC transporter ATP-binding protein [Mycoplasmopsis arginini]|uniref:Phosphonate ABC transporter ATP-binding protein n=1 Tax=Mycoplasmopsis arginini TaxID=2094 RepID=A0AA43QZR3_MYCAR|nr:phosphonate ABC transporter ATP-binding protein [Mycoplasmopsis arginini]ENY69537.1 Phosphonate ABC transporter, ATP-binding protein [Mycoplasmopsis arginini 7264]MCY2902777.1 phosphonate ABC transporter ATP-binding protein [Mycoplasmopsis arginini QMP CG1-2758]MDI3348077.1 phosphonate ABC transporter ATP-binding protein [Mycoplasmopsis arginini]MDI3348664.1 phosphonate ABC transporter ATP-binding protein [Mycoplasmopsis arginini]MDI3349515.1 phosphonate ABC transporter ATP-binding protein 